MAKPEDLEILKKIGICREWALKGLTVAVELENGSLLQRASIEFGS